jgi:hypothetical protein
MASERAFQQAFFGVPALLFAANGAVTIVWCAVHAGDGRDAGLNVSGTVIAVYILSESCDNLRDISEVPLRESQL